MADVRFTAVPVVLQSAVQQASQSFHQENKQSVVLSEQLLLLRGCLWGLNLQHRGRIPCIYLHRLNPRAFV